MISCYFKQIWIEISIVSYIFSYSKNVRSLKQRFDRYFCNFSICFGITPYTFLLSLPQHQAYKYQRVSRFWKPHLYKCTVTVNPCTIFRRGFNTRSCTTMYDQMSVGGWLHICILYPIMGAVKHLLCFPPLSLSVSLCFHVATLRWNLDTQEIYCNITLDRDSIQLGRSGHYSTFGHVLVTS